MPDEGLRVAAACVPRSYSRINRWSKRMISIPEGGV